MTCFVRLALGRWLRHENMLWFIVVRCIEVFILAHCLLKLKLISYVTSLWMIYSVEKVEFHNVECDARLFQVLWKVLVLSFFHSFSFSFFLSFSPFPLFVLFSFFLSSSFTFSYLSICLQTNVVRDQYVPLLLGRNYFYVQKRIRVVLVDNYCNENPIVFCVSNKKNNSELYRIQWTNSKTKEFHIILKTIIIKLTRMPRLQLYELSIGTKSIFMLYFLKSKTQFI